MKNFFLIYARQTRGRHPGTQIVVNGFKNLNSGFLKVFEQSRIGAYKCGITCYSNILFIHMIFIPILHSAVVKAWDEACDKPNVRH